MRHSVIRFSLFSAVLLVSAKCLFAQSNVKIFANDHNNGAISSATQTNTGGIGAFSLTGTQPQVLWHLFQKGNRTQYPSILRIQAAGSLPTDATAVGESAIQFHSGDIGDVKEWRIASILPVALNNEECSLKGALSFTTNVSNTNGIPQKQGPPSCIANVGAETEMVRMTADGTGILQSNPLEALHIWKRLTFHVGSEADYIGYNVTSTGSNSLARFYGGDPVRPNTPAMSLEFNRNGVIRLGNFGQGTAGNPVRVVENGGDFKGLVIGNSSGWLLGQGVGDALDPNNNDKDITTVAIGMMFSEPMSRLAIRSIGNTSETNALQIYNSTPNVGISPILTLKDNGNLGLRNVNAKGNLSLGPVFTFQDFPNSSVIAHNAYYSYNSSTDQGWKRIMPSAPSNNRPARIEMTNSGINLELGSEGAPEALVSEFNWGNNGLFVYHSNTSVTANVGIGERQPDARLVVKGTSNTSDVAVDVKNNNGNSLFTVRNDGKVGIGISNSQFKSEPKFTVAGHVQIGDLFYTVASNPLPSGQSYRLSVDGQVVTRSLLVKTTGWADFVFHDSYNLMSLDNLEDYIRTHKHLPDVPSEQQVNEKGVDVVETQKALLQKVEELTLYLIQMKKQNQQLQERVEQLEKK